MMGCPKIIYCEQLHKVRHCHNINTGNDYAKQDEDELDLITRATIHNNQQTFILQQLLDMLVQVVRDQLLHNFDCCFLTIGMTSESYLPTAHHHHILDCTDIYFLPHFVWG